MTLRDTIADIIWNVDGCEISQGREYYLEIADDIIKLVKEEKENIK